MKKLNLQEELKRIHEISGNKSQLNENFIDDILTFLGLKGKDSKDDKKPIDVSGITDKNVYEKILEGIGAKPTPENMKFMYAWRQSEGKAGRYNPFNTTQPMPGATNFNKVGVKHYQSLEDGVKATVKTLLNGYYPCIVNGLRNDIGADKIAKCDSLKTWGTGDLVSKVVDGYNKGAKPNISSLA